MSDKLESFEEKEIQRVMESRIQFIEKQYDDMLKSIMARLEAVKAVLADFNEMVAHKKLLEMEDKYQELMQDKGLKVFLDMYRIMCLKPQVIQTLVTITDKMNVLPYELDWITDLGFLAQMEKLHKEYTNEQLNKLYGAD